MKWTFRDLADGTVAIANKNAAAEKRNPVTGNFLN